MNLAKSDRGHSPAGDIFSACVLAEHVSVAHVSRHIHGEAAQVQVVHTVTQLQAAQGTPTGGQLPPEAPALVQEATLARRTAGASAAVAVAQRGRVARLQPRA